MAAKSFTLSVAATKTRLSDVYGGAAGANPDAANDIPYRQLILQAETADAKIGDATLTSTNYGALVPNAAPAAPIVLGPFSSGPVKLSDLWALGGGTGKLHILGIPY